MDDFESFARAIAPSLARFAYLLCADRHMAEDLVQSSLLKTYRSWERVQAANNREAYVRQITMREYLSWRRLRSSGEMATEPGEVSERQSQIVADPSDRVVEADAMWTSLHGLPKKQRSTLVMRYYLDLPDKEIAELLGCSASTVRSHISRGLKTLRRNTSTRREEAPR